MRRVGGNSRSRSASVEPVAAKHRRPNPHPLPHLHLLRNRRADNCADETRKRGKASRTCPPCTVPPALTNMSVRATEVLKPSVALVKIAACCSAQGCQSKLLHNSVTTRTYPIRATSHRKICTASSVWGISSPNHASEQHARPIQVGRCLRPGREPLLHWSARTYRQRVAQQRSSSWPRSGGSSPKRWRNASMLK